jgi:hypothetical protein
MASALALKEPSAVMPITTQDDLDKGADVLVRLICMFVHTPKEIGQAAGKFGSIAAVNAALYWKNEFIKPCGVSRNSSSRPWIDQLWLP